MKIKNAPNNIIYALHYKGQLLGTFEWTTQNGCPKEYLYGWRPPKKVYFRLSYARNGKRFLPKEILTDIEIFEYRPSRKIE